MNDDETLAAFDAWVRDTLGPEPVDWIRRMTLAAFVAGIEHAQKVLTEQ